jgi:hypothetical protein
MNSRRRSLVLALLGSLLLVPFCQAQDISLFNGRDLTGWKGLPEYWSIKDGAITGRITSKTVSKGNTFLIWQGGDVADFELSLKFKLDANNPEHWANSGIQFRAVLSNAERFALKGYQAELDPGTLQADGWPNMASLMGCVTDDPGPLLGAVGQKSRSRAGEASRMLAPIEVLGSLGTEKSVAASYRKNDWNDCRIVAVGNHIQTFINGLPAADVIDDGNRYSRGLLGLQLHGLGKEKALQFKDIKLRVLTGSVPAQQQLPITPTASLTLDPNQPLLDTFSQLAPNASAWVLAGLDEGVPPNVRQNLTYIREDLLDEYKQKPKASQDAYKLAHQLCSSMITALDERDQTLVRAGFRAVQADAGISGTNQALQARRNYMMSWPQYAREQAQRAELIRQGTAGAQVGKALPKVEWSTRTAALRKTLDGLYAQFREALRQSLTTK